MRLSSASGPVRCRTGKAAGAACAGSGPAPALKGPGGPGLRRAPAPSGGIRSRRRASLPLLSALLVTALLLSACALRIPAPSGAVSDEAARLAAPNRLDLALAQSTDGWRFSGLLTHGGEDKSRLPLLLLLRAAPARATPQKNKGAPAPGPAPGLEALLLTETGIRLCLLRVDENSAGVPQFLYGGAEMVCRMAAPALRALFLTPQPDPRDKPLAGEKGADPGGMSLTREDLSFRFSASGALEEKQWRGVGPWSAVYGEPVREGAFWSPETLHYKDRNLELRLLRLLPGES